MSCGVLRGAPNCESAAGSPATLSGSASSPENGDGAVYSLSTVAVQAAGIEVTPRLTCLSRAAWTFSRAGGACSRNTNSRYQPKCFA